MYMNLEGVYLCNLKMLKSNSDYIYIRSTNHIEVGTCLSQVLEIIYL